MTAYQRHNGSKRPGRTGGGRRIIASLIAATAVFLSAPIIVESASATWLVKWSSLMEDPDAMRASLPPLAFDGPTVPSKALITYFNAYGLNAAGVDHFFGTFTSGDFTLVANIYQPAEPRGTVILMHGFFDHSGTIAKAIHHLLTQGWVVATYDMPGHGLSSGAQAHIEDFADYERSLEDFLRLCREHLPPPYHVVAHSTGAAALFTRLLTQANDDLGHSVLIAPLVRSAFWHLSTISADVIDLFIDTVPRVFRDNSSDELFLAAVRDDPLQAREASLRWLDALVAWNARIADYPPSPKPILIIQGDQDSIVDWDYNLAFLEKKFPKARVAMVKGGRHQLLGESAAIREQVFGIIDRALDAPIDQAK